MERSFGAKWFCPRKHQTVCLAPKVSEGPVYSKNSERKRAFSKTQNFVPEQFFPELCHRVRLAPIVIVVWFSKKILTGNVFFGKTILGA
jgi:hypothetical protein